MKIELKTEIYPIQAVLAACYSFIDRAYFFLDTDPSYKKIIVHIKSKNKQKGKKLNLLYSELMEELLHSALRYKISSNNKQIREFIIARALFPHLRNSDPALPAEKTDYRNDPKGIAVTWEKKYGKQNAKFKI